MLRLSVIVGFVMVCANPIQETILEITEDLTPVDEEGCATSEFGCCFDDETEASGSNGEGCPCSISEFGCCPDGLTTASGRKMEGCLMSCNTSAYGCCPDGETPAHGSNFQGCCVQHQYGCCPDNYRPAEGSHNEGCGCEYARFGCCTDNITIARGPNMEGCGCEHSRYGCCPDRHTEAQGLDFIGCECHTYQFGCCPDGVTIASGPELEGCRCERSKYGCCGDETTLAKGPNMEGCDCSNSKYGCCPDGETEAKGDKFLNCSTVPVNRQAACALNLTQGTCNDYTVLWFYDMEYGDCFHFWYGGCDGNANRFVSREECEDVCVRPSPKDTCNLPKVKGECDGNNVRWYYNSEQEQCSQFIYGGCLGNANNFDTKEICEERCEPEKTEDQCNLALERGPCAGHFVRWGFNAERRRCEQFVWGGCGGNHNRYDSEAACQLQCTPPGQPRHECSLPQDPGNCTEKHPVWSFNKTDNRCVPFYYSGCGGNDNRFNSEHSCDDSCPRAYVQEICTLPAIVGDCSDYTIKWFFDTTKKRCRQFYYGGCGGNENNFLSESECENRCSEQPTTTTVKPELLQPVTESAVNQPRSEFCLLDIDKGPCTLSLRHWAYDVASGACVQFLYGGCGGNRNHFPTFDYCERYCGPTSPPQVGVKTHIVSEDTLLVVGSELNLVCEVDGYPVPDVFWFKDIEQIFSDTRITIAENRLTVSRVNKNDSGLYFCYAVNDLSLHQSSVLIIVEDPRWLSTTEDGETSTVNNESSTTETTESDLFSTTKYFRTTDRLDTASTEVRVKTRIISKDTWLEEGSELNLVCEVDGYPVPAVFWYKDYAKISSNDRITITENRLTVSHVNKNDSGLYRCYAVNDLSSHQSSVLIIVEDPRLLSTTEDGETSTVNNESSTTETTESDVFSTTKYFTTTDRLDTAFTEGGVKTHIVSEDTLLAVGSELTLVCEVDGYPVPDVYWFKDYPQIFSDDRITIAENRLTVSRVNKNDSGLYHCFAINDLSSHQSSVLIVVEDPRLLSTTEDGETSTVNNESSTTETTESDLFSTTKYFTTTDRLDTASTEVRVKTHIVSELNLVCEVEGYPVPEVSWFKDYAQIFSDDRITIAENRLTVSHVNKNDGGLYRCYAVNDLSSHQSSVLIIVEDPRLLSTKEDDETSTVNNEGSTTETTESDLFSTTKYFTTTDRLDTAFTEVGVKTHIISKDTWLQEGSELNLVCEVDGYPVPDVYWFKDYPQIFSDDRITIAENRLTVSRVNKNDSGLYHCFAINDLSSHQSSVLIVVEDPRLLSTTEDGETSTVNNEGSTTETTESDLFSTTKYFTTTDGLDTAFTEVRVKTHIISKDTWLQEGSELNLVCEVDGYPVPAVFWYKDYAEISSNDRISITENRLTVSRVNKNDSGLYHCFAINNLNSPHSSVLIIVEEPDESGTTRSNKTSEIREILMSPVPVVTHKAGIQLTLVCEVHVYPVPAVSWFKNHEEIFSDDRITMAETRLMVSRLNNNDTGLYECYAVNDFNSHYSSVQLIVEGLHIPPTCKDNPYFKCNLIVRSKVCSHKLYSKFCCKSCVEAEQLDVRDLQLQTDDTLYRE